MAVKTDTTCRALVVYRVVLDIQDRAGGQLVFVTEAGQRERVYLL